MKKYFKFLYAYVIMLLCSFIMFGCGVEIENIIIKSGTFDTTIVKNSMLITGDIEAVVKYSDNSTKEITDKDLKFGTIDTSTSGTKYLDITYEDYTFKLKITVVESTADLTTVTLFNSQIVSDYNSNIKTQDNKQEEFINKTEPYYVGDDNLFNFRINAKGIDVSGNIAENLSNVRTKIKFESITHDNNQTIYTELTDTEIENFATINTENSTIDFNESAIDREFKITVSAVNFDEDYFDQAPTFSLNIKVIDGYNVYNARDLSVLDNTGDFGWNDIKSSELQQISNSINGIILHSDIEVNDSDLPTGLFYNETEAKAIASGVTNQTIKGSLKDSADNQIYGRNLNNNQDFNFIGNYYQIDFSKISKVVVQNNDQDGIIVNDNDPSKEESITTHTCFLRFIPNENNHTYPKVNVKNISFKGNGKRSSRSIESGGMVLLKSTGVNFIADNTIYQDCYIGYMFEKFDDGGTTSENDNSKFTIINTKGYNCYNSLLYFWGSKHVIIENSELIGAGGPVMIVDHTGNETNTGSGGFPSKVDIINSNLESFVTGEEPWFVTYGATAIMSQIKAADAVYGSIPEIMRPTFLVDKDNVEDMINIVCVYKSAESEGLTMSRVRGNVTIFENREDYDNQQNNGDTSYGLYFEDEVSHNNIIDKARGVTESGSIDTNAMTNYFQSNKTGGYVATNGDFNGEFYVGDYTNIYLFNGMGAIFGLYPVSQN